MNKASSKTATKAKTSSASAKKAAPAKAKPAVKASTKTATKATKPAAKPMAKAATVKTAVKATTKTSPKAASKKTTPARTPVKTSTKTATKNAPKKVAKVAAPGSAKAVVKAASKKLLTQAVTKAAPVFSQKKAIKAPAKVAVKSASKSRGIPQEVFEEAITMAPMIKKSTPVDLTDLVPSVELSARILFRLRAEKVQLIDLRGKSDVADFFLIGTCASEAQMQAILTALHREFKTAHLDSLGVEYRAGVRWAVFDGVDCMVHLFEDKARDEYSLDRLWSDGAITELATSDFPSIEVGQDDSDDDYI